MKLPDPSMSLLTAVEEAIRTCKDEQATVDKRIELYRQILQSLKLQPQTAPHELVEVDDAASVASPVENEDMKLLEEALEKALRVRTGAEPPKQNPDGNVSAGPRKDATTTKVATSKEVRQPSFKGNQTSQNRKERSDPANSRSSVSHHPGRCKTTVQRNVNQRHPTSSAGTIRHQAAKKSPQAVSGTSSHDCQTKSDISGFHAKTRAPSGDDPSEGAAETTHPSNSRVPVSHAAQSLQQQHGIPSELASKWKSHRVKQSRLWDKVVAAQRKPEPGRSRFMERMTARFPADWPHGSPDQTRALLHRLTLRGHELAHRCRTKELPAGQKPEGGTELDKGNKYDSQLTFERLQMTAAELRDFADQVKHEWDAWDRWRPKGGCLCPTGATVEMEGGAVPLTVTYTTEGELTELERLRMRVALLQQEVLLEQALMDALSPHLTSIVPGCPDPSVLRDLYSLLGEGGQRFPAIVLDEPD